MARLAVASTLHANLRSGNRRMIAKRWLSPDVGPGRVARCAQIRIEAKRRADLPAPLLTQTKARCQDGMIEIVVASMKSGRVEE
jgi:hypothetical protein